MKMNRMTSMLAVLATCLLVSSAFSQMPGQRGAMGGGGNVPPPRPGVMMGGEGGGRLPGNPGNFGPGSPLGPGFGPAPGFAQPGFEAVVTPIPTRKPPEGEMILTGQRVRDAITKKLLDDVYYDHVPQNRFAEVYPDPRDRPKDDGVWPDLKAEDSIYSNFKVIDDQYIGYETNELRKAEVRMLIATEAVTPQKFFLISVTAADPYSSLPFNIDTEEERDKKIEEWNQRWLAAFRQQPSNNPMSNFLPLYVPRPPSFPYSDPPVGFVYTPPGAVDAAQAGMPGAPPGMMGPPGPMGAAQTQYFTPPGQGQAGGAGVMGLNRARGVAGQMNQRGGGQGRGGRPPGMGGGGGG